MHQNFTKLWNITFLVVGPLWGLFVWMVWTSGQLKTPHHEILFLSVVVPGFILIYLVLSLLYLWLYMRRDLAEPFPEAPMPAGLEVRPVKPEQLRVIFEASNEAFRDHWGSRDESEEGYKAEMESPAFHPELWKVAWDGDQMASVVHNFVDEKENAEYKRKRGYTEGICTRRPWRKLGLARSLLVQSMQMFKQMAMTETALSVDSQNLSGALRLYESVGYRKIKLQVVYRKAME